MPRMKWVEEHRHAVHLLYTNVANLPPQEIAAIFNALFPDHIRGCGYEEGIRSEALQSQYRDRNRADKADVWRNIINPPPALSRQHNIRQQLSAQINGYIANPHTVPHHDRQYTGYKRTPSPGFDDRMRKKQRENRFDPDYQKRGREAKEDIFADPDVVAPNLASGTNAPAAPNGLAAPGGTNGSATSNTSLNTRASRQEHEAVQKGSSAEPKKRLSRNVSKKSRQPLKGRKPSIGGDATTAPTAAQPKPTRSARADARNRKPTMDNRNDVGSSQDFTQGPKGKRGGENIQADVHSSSRSRSQPTIQAPRIDKGTDHQVQEESHTSAPRRQLASQGALQVPPSRYGASPTSAASMGPSISGGAALPKMSISRPASTTMNTLPANGHQDTFRRPGPYLSVHDGSELAQSAAVSPYNQTSNSRYHMSPHNDQLLPPRTTATHDGGAGSFRSIPQFKKVNQAYQVQRGFPPAHATYSNPPAGNGASGLGRGAMPGAAAKTDHFTPTYPYMTSTYPTGGSQLAVQHPNMPPPSTSLPSQPHPGANSDFLGQDGTAFRSHNGNAGFDGMGLYGGNLGGGAFSANMLGTQYSNTALAGGSAYGSEQIFYDNDQSDFSDRDVFQSSSFAADTGDTLQYPQDFTSNGGQPSVMTNYGTANFAAAQQFQPPSVMMNSLDDPNNRLKPYTNLPPAPINPFGSLPHLQMQTPSVHASSNQFFGSFQHQHNGFANPGFPFDDSIDDNAYNVPSDATGTNHTTSTALQAPNNALTSNFNAAVTTNGSTHGSIMPLSTATAGQDAFLAAQPTSAITDYEDESDEDDEPEPDDYEEADVPTAGPTIPSLQQQPVADGPTTTALNPFGNLGMRESTNTDGTS